MTLGQHPHIFGKVEPAGHSQEKDSAPKESERPANGTACKAELHQTLLLLQTLERVDTENASDITHQSSNCCCAQSWGHLQLAVADSKQLPKPEGH